MQDLEAPQGEPPEWRGVTLSRAGATGAWLALLAGVAVTLHGLWTRHLFAQTIWTAGGFGKLCWFTGAYALVAAAVVAFRRRGSLAVSAGAVVLALVLTLGPVAVLSVALFLLSSWKLGALLARAPERGGLRGALLATSFGVAIWMTVLSVAVHFCVNYALVYLVLFAAPLAVRPRHTLELCRAFTRGVSGLNGIALGDALALMLAAFPVLCHLALIPKPEIGADALSMHLLAPAWVAYRHVWPFDFQHFVWAVMPMGADWCFTGAYVLGGEYAARLLNFAFLALAVSLVYAASRPLAGRAAALLCAGVFASTPLVQLVTGSLMVENLQALFLTGAVLAAAWYYESGGRLRLYSAALLAGAALATKFGSSALAVPVLLFVLWTVWAKRAERRGEGRHAALAIALALAIGAVPYAFAAARTGNPFFPFMNDVFRSPYFDAKALLDARFTRHLGLSTPFEVVFGTRGFLEGQDGAAGFQFLVLLPLAVLVWRRRWPVAGTLALAGVVVHCVATFTTLEYARYVYAAFPLLSIAGAVAVGRLRPRRSLYAATFCTLAGILLLNVYFLPASGWWHNGFYVNPFDAAARTDYLTTGAPERLLVQRLNREHPGETAAFFGTDEVAGLRATSYSFAWHNWCYERQVMKLTGPIGYGHLARSLGVRWFVAPAAWTRAGADGVVPGFLARFTVPAGGVGTLELRGWRPGAADELAALQPEQPLKACDAAMIDDQGGAVRYRGRWRGLQNFGQACGGTLTYASDMGAEASFEFSGAGVTYVFTRAYTRGVAEVLIDGVSRGEVDQFSSGIAWRSEVTYGGLTPGRHVITIRVLRKRAANSSDFDVDVDGFVVR